MSSQMRNDTSNFLHKIYTNDPVLFKSYVNKRVKITTDDGNVHTGIVYTVDPVSESIVIMEPVEGEEKMRMKIIMRPAIKTVECSHDREIVLPEMFVAPPVHYTEEDLIKRKNAIIKLLADNRFPVTEEEGVLLIEDTVRIEPPYKTENCICLNSIILNRMQALLSRVFY